MKNITRVFKYEWDDRGVDHIRYTVTSFGVTTDEPWWRLKYLREAVANDNSFLRVVK